MLDKDFLAKIVVVSYAGLLVLYTTYRSFEYALASLSVDGGNLTVVGTITVIQGPITGVLWFVSKLCFKEKVDEK